MNRAQQYSLSGYLIAMADDELIIGHRDSEWTGHGPILEEDIAFTNIALDEIGHARLWYQLSAELLGEDPARFPDQQVYLRYAKDFRCLQIVELPKGDWAFTLLRQYLFDSFEAHRLAGVMKSLHKPLADTAVKIRTEELYHLRHTRAWVPRLGLGTEESHGRMQAALDELWPYAQALGASLPGEIELIKAGLVPGNRLLFERWAGEVTQFLKDANLQVPPPDSVTIADRRVHSEYFDVLIQDLQEVARTEPEAVW